MKKVLYILAAVAAIVSLDSCKKDGNGKLDPNAKISLRAAGVVKSDPVTNPDHLSANEIVKQTLCVEFIHPIDKTPSERGFEANQRDFVNNRLLMFGTDIIDQWGDYHPGFIEAKEVVLSRYLTTERRRDTIAYIPQSVLLAAQKAIKKAYYAGDYATCYKIFDQAFTFTPITIEEWRVLKAKGEN